MRQFSPDRISPLIAALVAVASGLYVASFGIRLPDGTPVLAVDDSYIHLQYAWQAAHGHFMQYITGDPPTSGATSLFYVLLLAVGFILGVPHGTMPAVVQIGGGLLFALSAALLADLTRRIAVLANATDRTLAPWAIGLLAGVLFAGSGWMVWCFLSGMETGLLITLLLGALLALTTRRNFLAAVLIALAALTRPEVVIFAVAVLIAQWLVRDRSAPIPYREWLTYSLPLLATFFSFGLNYALTGSFSSTGLQAKSLFGILPFYPLDTAWRMLRMEATLLVLVFGTLTPDGVFEVFPLTHVLAIIGALRAWQSGNIMVRRFVVVALLWWLVGLTASTALESAFWHFYRYQMPLYPPLLILAAVALADLVGYAVRRRIPAPQMHAALALMAVVWGILSVRSFAVGYAASTDTTFNMNMRLANWLRQNTPTNSLIAVEEVGVIGYLSERPLIDVVGLATLDMAPVFRNGSGSLQEIFEARRVDYFATFLHSEHVFFDRNGPEAAFGEEVFRATSGPMLPFRRGGEHVIFRLDPPASAEQDLPFQLDIRARIAGLSLVDQLDVADLTDEDAHEYSWWNTGHPEGMATWAWRLQYRADPSVVVPDGGRALTGGNAFSLSTRPDDPILLVARLLQNTDMVLRVTVNGVDAGVWRLPAVPGEWLESAFLIPAELVTDERTQVRLAVEDMFGAPADARFSPFHYWAYQGDQIAMAPPEAGVAVETSFGQTAALVGYDLNASTLSGGDSLVLNLYWRALAPQRQNLRVFVHLTDPANPFSADGILAQTDAAPRAGTYPFWVWGEDEIVSDSLTMIIPLDTPPGEYLLLMGIYDPLTGQRVQVTGEGAFDADRFLLTTVNVR